MSDDINGFHNKHIYRYSQTYQTRPNPRLPYRSHHILQPTPMRQHGLEETRCAGPQHLGNRQYSRHIAIVFRVIRFQRPNRVAQPIMQRQVLGQPAQQRLREVSVRIDEPWNEDFATAVDYRDVGFEVMLL